MKNWITTLENHIVKWLIGTFITSIGVAITFYFDANYTMAQNTRDIKEVKAIVKTIDTTPTINTLKIHQVKKEMSELTTDFKEMSRDFKDFQREYRQDKDRIIDLLMKIKEDK